MTEQQPAALNNASASTYLGVSPAQLRLSRHTGELFGGVSAPRFIKLGKRSVRYLATDLEDWLQQHQKYQNTAQLSQGGVE